MSSLTLSAMADPGRKQPLGRYAKLWSTSAFTVKPIIEATEDAPSLLDDYSLAGVSALEGGYSVVLINKKKREERIHLLPGLANVQGFRVISVRQDPIEYKNTTVTIGYAGNKTGQIGYDEKFLALKARPMAAKKKPVAKRPPGTPTPVKAPVRVTPGKPGTPQPRVRRVPVPPKR